jgi:hypothetical protein
MNLLMSRDRHVPPGFCQTVVAPPRGLLMLVAKTANRCGTHGLKIPQM